MAKTETVSTNFPFPEVLKTMTDAEKKEANRVRAQTYRKAQTAAFAAFGKIMKAVNVSGVLNLDESDVDPLAVEAYQFLSARATRGAGRPAGAGAARVSQADKVREFFMDPAHHTDKDGNDTPGKIAFMHTYIILEMDTKRVMDTLKRMLDDAAPADRLWISADTETKTWTIEGAGENPPPVGPARSPRRRRPTPWPTSDASSISG